MSADLEREAREAAEAIAGDTYARGSIYWDRCVTDCSRAFIAAATLREKEIEELRSKLVQQAHDYRAQVIFQRLRYEARTQLADSQAWRDNRKRLADNLDHWWRTHAAQPAKEPPSHDVLMSILNSLATKTISVGKAQKILMQWATGEKVDDFAEANEEAVHSMMFGDDEHPAPAVAMTPALETLIQTCESWVEDISNYDDDSQARPVQDAIAAVRSQKVRMPKVRGALNYFLTSLGDEHLAPGYPPLTRITERAKLTAALAELDAMEGRK